MRRARNDWKYIAILAVTSFLMLLIGGLTRPGDQQAEVSPGSVASDLLQLERVTQRREVEQIADYFAYVAATVEESVVLLGATGHSGVVWQGGEVVTSSRLGPFPRRDRTALGSREVVLETELSAPHLPYVLLKAPLDAAVSDRRQVRLYGRGAWLLAVWRSLAGGLRYVAGNLFGVTDGRCGDVELPEVQTNLDLRSMQPGSGIFSLDGGLLAIVLDCAGQPIAAEASALEVRARAEPGLQDRLAGRFGLMAESASEAELQFFGREAGVLVKATWWGYRAHEAGLLPGDLILSLDGLPVESLADLAALLLPVSREVRELEVWRAGRRRDIQMLARATTEAAVSSRGFVGGPGGLPVESVIPGSLAERAGARPGDRLLAVNQRPTASHEDFGAALGTASGSAVHVILERRGRTWGALVHADE